MTTLNNLDFIPVSKWNDYYQFPSVGAIRQLIFYNRNDFNSKVIRRIGKRIYIKVSNFIDWIENNKEVA